MFTKVSFDSNGSVHTELGAEGEKKHLTTTFINTILQCPPCLKVSFTVYAQVNADFR
jgi:hypothetical protein